MRTTPEETAQTTPAVTTFTRRTFLKTSALAVGAVAVLSQGRALADVDGGSGSSSYYVLGSPAGLNPPSRGDNYIYTPPLTVNGITYNAKAATLASPSNATDSSLVSISVELHGWKTGSAARSIAGWTLKGKLIANSFSTEPVNSLSFSDSIKLILKTWIENAAVHAGDIEDHHSVQAKIEIIHDNSFPLYREIRFRVFIAHYRQEYIKDSSGIMMPHSEPVEVGASFPTPHTMYVQRMP